MVTYRVILAFELGKSGVLIADEPQEIHGGDDRAVAAAKRLSEKKAGVIAFSRSGDPQTGDWGDAIVLWQAGVIPEEAMAIAS